VSITTQSGVSGTCTATTTPACTIALGAITPTSITTVTGSYSGIITWPNDGDQQYMGNTDVSKFHIGGWAANSGSIYTLLGSTDFAHYYFCHNVATDPSTGITWAVTSPATAVAGLPTTVTAGQAIEIVYNSVAGTPTNSAATTWYQY
jgi:hypothetical protein